MSETEPNTAKSPPNRCRLNDRLVKTAKPEAKRKLYWDSIQPGLVLSVEATGHKSFKLIYTFNGRARWYTIGNAGTAARSRLSEDLHSSPDTLNPEAVTHDQLSDEVKVLIDWLEDIKARQGAAEKPTVSYGSPGAS